MWLWVWITLLMTAVPVFHLYVCCSEAGHLNRWKDWQIIVMPVISGTLFFYFVSPSARRKGLFQLLLIGLFFLTVYIDGF